MKGGVSPSIVQDIAIHQGTLEAVVRKIFPGEKNLIGNARKDAYITNPATGAVLELDIWLPNQQIAFEFQDAYHYVTTWYSQFPLFDILKKDQQKKEIVQQRGESIIGVPCWWDGTESSLVATTVFHRPDLLLQSDAMPIPLNPPRFFFRKGGIPGVGELMNASFPADGKLVDYVSPTNSWWMGEKYDGVRICWNSERQTIYTRAGHTLELPPSYFDQFPDIFMDAEFWFGRGFFPDAQRIVKGELDSVTWHFFRITAFDVPMIDVQHQPFETRYALLLDDIPDSHPFVITAVRVMCSFKKHLKNALKQILDDGGEGVILRKPKSTYEPGRTPNLMKMKASRGDREGIVVAVDARQAVTLKLPDGVTFVVAAQNVKQGLQPKLGDIVTFSYEDFSRRAAPVSPNIYRIRTDVSWKDVVKNFEEEIAFSKRMEDKFTAKRYGFWSAEKGKNLRKFFGKFAKSKGVDPLLAETWYSLTWRDLRTVAEGKSIASRLKGGLVSALVNLFPEIRFDVSKFRVVRNNWESVKNRRKWFDGVARLRGFDPLLASNWYKIKVDSIINIKGASNILEYYSRSLVKALIHAYPEINFDENKFPTVSKFYWQSKENRRKLLIDFATSNNFDPLIAINWYSAAYRDLAAWKGASRMLTYYEGSYSKALLDLFPDIGLDPSKFESVYWKSTVARKTWFEAFAKKWEIDPLVPADWQRVAHLIKQEQSAQAVLKLYDGSIFKALSSLFPDIGLTRDQFHQEGAWEDSSRRKKFLLRFAANRSINPKKAQDWYTVTRDHFLTMKGGHSFLKHFAGNIPTALMDSFPNIGLSPSQFIESHDKNTYWKAVQNRRKFFMEFAIKNNFDPLLPENWYPITHRNVLLQGGNRVLLESGGSVVKSLQYAFPELKFVDHKFASG